MTDTQAPPGPVEDDIGRGTPPHDRPARRFAIGSLCGGVVALVVVSWLATHGFGAFFDEPLQGDFFDAQARSLFDGRWDVPEEVVTFERFTIDGHVHMYFGPTPALLRMPVLAVTDALDGRLSRISMVLASAVLLLGVARLSWLARRTVRGQRPVTTSETVIAGAVIVVAGLGTVVPYLAGWTAVYHEAIVWGVAFALVSYGALAAWLLDHRPRDLALAGAAAALAVLARGSVGFGPIAAIALTAAAHLATTLRTRPLHWRTLPWPRLSALTAAAAIPLALYGYVNATKFGAPFAAPPYGEQDVLRDWPPRIAAMEANGGSLFGPGYAPTILFHYLRPDGIRFDRLFPWVLFPPPARVLGGAVFESLRPATSLTAASPLALALAVAGTWWTARHRQLRTIWLAPLAGTLIGSVGAVSLAFVDQRYQGDFVPLLVVPGVLATWWTVDRLAGRAAQAWRVALALAAVGLGAWSAWVNLGTAFVYQRAQIPWATVDDRASLVEAQLTSHDLHADGLPSRVTAGDALPGTAPAASLFVLGDCAGLYRSDGVLWYSVEQTSATGFHDLVVHLEPAAAGRQPVLSSVDDLGTTILWASNLPDGRVLVEYQWEALRPDGTFEALVALPPVGRRPDGGVPLSARIDRRDGITTFLQIRSGERLLFGEIVTRMRADFEVGRQTTLEGVPMFAGRIDELPAATPLCDRLVELGLDVAPS